MKSFDAWTDEIADRIQKKHKPTATHYYTDLDATYLDGVPLSEFKKSRRKCNLYYDTTDRTFYYTEAQYIVGTQGGFKNFGMAKTHTEWGARLWSRRHHYKYVKELNRLFIKHVNMDAARYVNVICINTHYGADDSIIKDDIERFFDQLHT